VLSGDLVARTEATGTVWGLGYLNWACLRRLEAQSHESGWFASPGGSRGCQDWNAGPEVGR